VTGHDAALKGTLPMNDKIKSVQDDLAFLRTLAEGPGGSGLGVAGSALYSGAGLIYGLQCMVYYGQVIGLIRMGAVGNQVLAWLPTVIFLIMMTVVIVIERKRSSGGVTNRAVNAAFTGTGIANLALILIFASAAARNHDFRYWLFHPAVVFVLQGAVWYVVFVLRKRIWMALVALGWLVSGVALGMLINRADLYLLIAGLGLFAWMMIPGYVMMRQARQSAA
jgi:hypothetical protein